MILTTAMIELLENYTYSCTRTIEKPNFMKWSVMMWYLKVPANFKINYDKFFLKIVMENLIKCYVSSKHHQSSRIPHNSAVNLVLILPV